MLTDAPSHVPVTNIFTNGRLVRCVSIPGSTNSWLARYSCGSILVVTAKGAVIAATRPSLDFIEKGLHSCLSAEHFTIHKFTAKPEENTK